MRTGLRRGDFVEVKNASEILNTLNNEGALDALPFMPEMVQYCGRRFVVDKRAEKICGASKSSGSRRMPNTVLLEDLRCDGSGHDGCQADCRFYWKESWLRRIAPGEHVESSQSKDNCVPALAERIFRKAKEIREVDGCAIKVYRCQATELLDASLSLSVWDPRPYLREFTSGNVSFGHFLRVSARAFIEEPLRKFRLISTVPLPGTRTGPVTEEPLDLQPGDWVQVKTKGEIAAILTPDGRERGLWFDREMLPFCGGTYQVKQRVNRFIDDITGRMIELKRDCVTLSGVVCSGDLSLHRHFCPRAIYPYWRENWLRRVNLETPGPSSKKIGNAKLRS